MLIKQSLMRALSPPLAMIECVSFHGMPTRRDDLINMLGKPLYVRNLVSTSKMHSFKTVLSASEANRCSLSPRSLFMGFIDRRRGEEVHLTTSLSYLPVSKNSLALPNPGE